MATEVGLAFVRLIPSMDGFGARARALLDRELAGLDPRITVRADIDTSDLDARLRNLTINARVTGDADRLGDSLGRIGSMAGSLAGVAVGVGKIGAAAGAAVPLVAGAAAALADIAPAAGVAATGIVAAGLAAGALKLGMLGVADATALAFDPEASAEDLAAAMEGLAPPAREFVRTLRGLRPAFDSVQLAVQRRLFEGLGPTLRTTARAVRDDLGRALGDSATSLNLMGKQVLNTATGLSKSGALGQALDSATDGLRNMVPLPSTLVQGLVQIGAAAGPSFERLTASAGGALDSLSQRMTAAFESGAMQQAIEHAIDLIGQLFSVLGNIGSIAGSIFGAADASGAGFLGTLETITGALAEAFASPEVQQALGALMETIGALAAEVGPLLISALQAIAPVFTTLGPPVQRLIAALGDGLGPLIEGLAPVLEVAAEALGDLLDAVSPLLPIIGDTLGPLLGLLADALGTVIDAVMPLVEQLGGALADALLLLAPTLLEVGTIVAEDLAPALAALLTALLPLLPALTNLLFAVLTPLLPVLPELANLIVAIVDALLPLLEIAVAIVVPLTNLAAALLGWLAAEAVVPLIQGIIDILNVLVGAVEGLLGPIQTAIDGVIGAFQWLYDVLVGNSIVPDLIREIVSLFAGLPGRAARALANLGQRIVEKAVSAGRRLVETIRNKIGDALDVLRRLPERAKNAIGDLGSILWDAGKALIQGFIDGIESMIQPVKDVLGAITDMIPDIKGPPARDRRLLTPAGQLVMEGFQRGIARQVPALRRQLQSLTAGLAPMMSADLSASITTLPAAAAARPAAAAAPVLRMVADGSRASRVLMALMQDSVRLDYGGDPVAALRPPR